MTDQQLQALIWQLSQKVDDLETKLRRIERTVGNIDANIVQTANLVQQIWKKTK